MWVETSDQRRTTEVTETETETERFVQDMILTSELTFDLDVAESQVTRAMRR